MKKNLILLLICLCFFAKLSKSQSGCASLATTYDMVFSNNTVLPPSPSGQYMFGYICTGTTVTDSMNCCTRFMHVVSGGTLIAGPLSYGTAYLKAGATFDGQNTAQNWFVYAEAGANVLNYSGNVITCTAVTFPAGNCFMSVGNTETEKSVTVIQQPNQLQFSFSNPLSPGRIEIYDISGKQLLNQTAENTTMISVNTESFCSGMYFYRVYQNGEFLSSGKISLTK